MPVAETLILLQLLQKWPEIGVMKPRVPAAPAMRKAGLTVVVDVDPQSL